ncbi:hypothetical protein BGZ83_005271 [Gryganskiella cystojenkinii]|nr:hypothetical protein BGZ83_005271 [Gryganskiella cystojenkinii]
MTANAPAQASPSTTTAEDTLAAVSNNIPEHTTNENTLAVGAAGAGAEQHDGEDGDEFDDDGIIDHTTFDQLLEMDDEEDHEFSRSLVWNYFDQAEMTFKDMDSAMSKLDFPDLSRLGHFLKGSSAALGLRRVTDSCERLQHYGNRKDAKGVNTITNEEAENLIRALLVQVRDEYNEAKNYLTVFYDGEDGVEEQA